MGEILRINNGTISFGSAQYKDFLGIAVYNNPISPGAFVNNLSTCLVSGSLITLWDGTEIPIERIKPGDKVKTFDTIAKDGKDSKENVWGQVTWVQEPRIVDGYFEVETDDGTLLKITGEHPVFVTQKNGKGRFTLVKNLKLGQSFLNKEFEQTIIIRKEWVNKSATVHNMTVDAFHNYFGAGILCHNTG